MTEVPVSAGDNAALLHIPVMLSDVQAALSAVFASSPVENAAAAAARQKRIMRLPQSENITVKADFADRRIIDGTFGNGGYSRAFLEAGARVLGLDCDPQAVRNGQLLAEQYQGRLTVVSAKFSELERIASAADFAPADAVVLDIGVSSMQIDRAERGFSFQKNGPLDMRMSGKGVSAAWIVNNFKSGDLARIFHFYGEERHAGRIARMIERRRAERAFVTTLDLAQAITALGLHRQEKTHAATRVFQALRIYVNDELGELARALTAAERVLRPNGCLAVVTFHSLEDRIVKRFFAERCGGSRSSRHAPQRNAAEPGFISLFKGAKPASADEAAENPRARSAKLRVGIRTQAEPFAADYSLFNLPKLPLLSDLPQQKPLEAVMEAV